MLAYGTAIGRGNKASARGRHSEAEERYRHAADLALRNRAPAEAAAALILACEDVLSSRGQDAELDLLREVLDMTLDAPDFLPRTGHLWEGATVGKLRAAVLDDIIERLEPHGDREELLRMHVRAREVSRDNHEPFDAAEHAACAADQHWELGRRSEARRLWESALQEITALGDGPGTARLHRAVGNAAFRDDDLVVALNHLSRAITGFRLVGDPSEVAKTQDLLANVRRDMGDHAGAADDHVAVADFFDTLEGRGDDAERSRLLAEVHRGAHDFRHERPDAGWAKVHQALDRAMALAQTEVATVAMTELVERDASRALFLAKAAATRLPGLRLQVGRLLAAAASSAATPEERAALLDAGVSVLCQLLEDPDRDPTRAKASFEVLADLLSCVADDAVAASHVAAVANLLRHYEVPVMLSTELTDLAEQLHERGHHGAVHVLVDAIARGTEADLKRLRGLDDDTALCAVLSRLASGTLRLTSSLAALGGDHVDAWQERRLLWLGELAQRRQGERRRIGLAIANHARQISERGDQDAATAKAHEAAAILQDVAVAGDSRALDDLPLVYVLLMDMTAADSASRSAAVERQIAFLAELDARPDTLSAADRPSLSSADPTAADQFTIRTLASAGRPAEAERRFEALDAVRRTDSTDPEVIGTLGDLCTAIARAHHEPRDDHRAATWQRRAMGYYAALPAHPDREARAAGELGVLLAALGDADGAAEAYQRALDLLAGSDGDPDEQARITVNFGVLEHQRGRLTEAVSHLERAVVLLARVPGAATRAALARSRMTLALKYLGQLEQAERVCRESATALRTSDASDNVIWDCRDDLAEVLLDQGRYVEAQEHWQELVKTAPEPGKRDRIQGNLALVLHLRGQHRECETTVRALLGRDEHPDGGGPEADSRSWLHNLLACALRDQGHHREAERLFEEAVAHYEQADNARMLATVKAEIAVSLERQQSQASAERLLLEAVETFSVLGLAALESSTRADLARVLLTAGRTTEAEELVQAAVTDLDGRPGSEHAAAVAREVWAQVLGETGREREAQQVYLHALSTYASRPGNDQAVGRVSGALARNQPERPAVHDPSA